jgi:hypothetical protein
MQTPIRRSVLTALIAIPTIVTAITIATAVVITIAIATAAPISIAAALTIMKFSKKQTLMTLNYVLFVTNSIPMLILLCFTAYITITSFVRIVLADMVGPVASAKLMTESMATTPRATV